ncbi:MAG TPA: hypothetical protein VJA86_02955 [Candidatus Nanoarchaeia archaeon]|nr:hypothetical protein [Candidatus Nanoarchaeia archaeon]
MARQSAVKISAVEELIKHQKIQPKIYDEEQETPTQTKPNGARIITKHTANGLYEKSCIDVVIEKKAEGDFSPAVYIRPLEENVSSLLKNTCARNIKSFEKELTYIELNERFLRMVPGYKGKFVFKEFIFWYSYDNSLHSRLIETARAIV